MGGLTAGDTHSFFAPLTPGAHLPSLQYPHPQGSIQPHGTSERKQDCKKRISKTTPHSPNFQVSAAQQDRRKQVVCGCDMDAGMWKPKSRQPGVQSQT